jgi:hypothetical protein
MYGHISEEAAQRDRKEKAEEKRNLLRDQFAMAALTGLIMRNGGLLPKIVAEDAYYIADAMLEEREAK